MGDAQNPTENVSSQNENSKKFDAKIVALIVGTLLMFAVIAFVAWAANRNSKDEQAGVTKRVSNENLGHAFVEIVYEQSFLDLDGSAIPHRAHDEDLNAYIFQDDSAILFPCSDEHAQNAQKKLWIGKRFHNQFHNHHVCWQQLVSTDQKADDWRIAAEPTVDETMMMGASSWVRHDLAVSVERKGADCLVSANGNSATLAPGQTNILWSGKRNLTAAEFAGELRNRIKQQKSLDVEFDAQRLLAKWPFDDQGSITIHARVIAIYHGPVEIATWNPQATRAEALTAFHQKEWEKAKELFQKYLGLVPEDSLAKNLLAQTHDNEHRDPAPAPSFKIHGHLKMNDGQPANHRRAWIGIRTPNQASDHVQESSRLKDGKFQFEMPAGDYVVTVYFPGFKPLSQKVTVQSSEVDLSFQFTDKDQISSREN